MGGIGEEADATRHLRQVVGDVTAAFFTPPETAAPPPESAPAQPRREAAPSRSDAPEPSLESRPESGPEPTSRPAPASRGYAHPLAPTLDNGLPHRPDVHFRPRKGAQRLAGVLLLLSLTLAGLAGWSAWERQSTAAAGTAAIVAVLALALWFFRAASTPMKVRIVGGMLEVEERGRASQWDLENPHVPIEVYGEPGRRGWRVQLLRPGVPPYVLDGTVVDPREFMRHLRTYRPEL